jgi:hypothetical protein
MLEREFTLHFHDSPIIFFGKEIGGLFKYLLSFFAVFFFIEFYGKMLENFSSIISLPHPKINELCKAGKN